MDSVVHFELPSDNRQRISKFYSQAFGWKTKELGEEHGHYVLATTAQTDDQGMLLKPGAINGGIYQRSNERPAQFPTVVIGVDDLEASMKKITEAGGKVLGEPVEIPGYGTYVSFNDTEGNRLSVIEPTKEMQHK